MLTALLMLYNIQGHAVINSCPTSCTVGGYFSWMDDSQFGCTFPIWLAKAKELKIELTVKKH